MTLQRSIRPAVLLLVMCVLAIGCQNGRSQPLDLQDAASDGPETEGGSGGPSNGDDVAAPGDLTGDAGGGPQGADAGGTSGGAEAGSEADAPVVTTDANQGTPGVDAVGADVPTGSEAGVPKLPNGKACTDGTACISGFCVDKVCCESECSGQCQACGESGSEGRCVAVMGSPRSPRTACTALANACGGSCDGTNPLACAYPGGSTECKAAACQNGTATTRSVCDGKGGCPVPMMVSCGVAGCTGNICAGGCSPQQPCSTGNYCAGGKCVPLKVMGAVCSGADECQNGHCVDGVCCESACDGACQTCDAIGNAGHCVAVHSADDDHCTGKSCDVDGLCKSRAGDMCTGNSDCATGFCVDGHCCGASKCGPCRSCTGGGGACVPVVSQDDADCPGTCDASGVCKSKQGQTCATTSGGCIGGTFCAADGVCCDSACTGSCMACDLAGSIGKCTPVASGNPHGKPTCGSGECAGTCAGRPDGACSYASAPATCGAGPSCANNMAVGQSVCTNGSCMTPAPQVCSNGCAGTVCKTSCSADSDCTAPSICVANLCMTVTSIAVGGTHACAAFSDGSVRCWGSNSEGESGAPVSQYILKPVTISGLTSATSVAALSGSQSNAYSCARTVDGSVYCWGYNRYGLTGTNEGINQTSTPVKASVSGATAVTAGVDHICVLRTNAVTCWGSNQYGQRYANGAMGVSVVAAAELETCVILTGGSVQCWGASGYGVDGVSSLTNVFGLATGIGHTCALVGSGTAWCSGYGGHGELGNGMLNDSQTPVQVTGLTGAKAIAAGLATSCAIAGDGSVRCWGEGFDYSPITISGVSGAKAISVGGDTACAIVSSGAVMCWGDNSNGQLGGGSAGQFTLSPVKVTGW